MSGALLTDPHTPSLATLESGDRLSRAEFERRYAALPRLKKAELVDGVVYIEHADPHFDLVAFLGLYRAATPGVLGGDNATLRLDLDNELQPDAHLRIPAERGGLGRLLEVLREGLASPGHAELVQRLSSRTSS